MAKSTSKRLVSRDLLESLSRPLLARLLENHALFCRARRIDLAVLAASSQNDFAALTTLFEVLSRGDAALPPDLARDFLDLREVAEGGHDDFYAIAKERGAAPPPMGLTPGNLALTMQLDHPELFRAVRVRVQCSSAGSFVEFDATTDATVRDAMSAEVRAKLERLIGAWFASKNRTAFCEVWVTESETEIFIEITHCETPRSQGELDTESMTRRLRTFVATRRDHVIVDKESGRLAVQARYANEKELYRATLGEVFHGDAKHYVARDLFALGSLLERGAAAFPADPALGVESVIVRALHGRRADTFDVKLGYHGPLFEAITPEWLRAQIAADDIKQLTLDIQIAGRDKLVRVQLTRPNRLVMERGDSAVERVVRGYFTSRGVLAAPRRQRGEGAAVSTLERSSDAAVAGAS